MIPDVPDYAIAYAKLMAEVTDAPLSLVENLSSIVNRMGQRCVMYTYAGEL